MNLLNPNPLNRLTEEPPAAESRTRCLECGSLRQTRDYKRGEITCSDCGLVIEDGIMDPGPEWRAFDSEQVLARRRTGPPITYTLHDKGLSTVIDPRDRDSRGLPLAPERKRQIHRLRKWDRRGTVSNSAQRNLLHALSELQRLVAQLRLPRNIQVEASMIYRKIVEKGLRGRSIECSAASAIYIACRQFGVPRTLHEIAEVTKYEKREIGRSYRTIARDLGIHLPPVNGLQYVPRFISRLGLPPRVGTRATQILKECIEDQKIISGKGPTGLAGGAIYTACVLEDVDRTQNEIAKVTGSTQVTVRNRYRDIVEYLDLDV